MANPKNSNPGATKLPTIKIRYGKDDISPTSIEETPTEPPKTKSKRKMTDAQKEALEKARLVLLEKKKREKEDKERLKQQEKEIDKVIMERASKGIELRMKMEQLKKDLELLQEEEKKEIGALREPTLEPPLPTAESQPKPPPEPTPESLQEPLPESLQDQPSDEIKIVSRIQGKKKKGRKVILIDASVFENSSDDEDQPKIHKIKKQMREPRRRADRRTRFERDADLVYSDEEDDDYEPVRPPQPRRQEQQYIMSDNLNENVRHYAPAPTPPNPHQQIVSHEQMRYENPLYSRIFG